MFTMMKLSFLPPLCVGHGERPRGRGGRQILQGPGSRPGTGPEGRGHRTSSGCCPRSPCASEWKEMDVLMPGWSGHLQAACSIPTGSREKVWKCSGWKLEATVIARGLLRFANCFQKGKGVPEQWQRAPQEGPGQAPAQTEVTCISSPRPRDPGVWEQYHVAGPSRQKLLQLPSLFHFFRKNALSLDTTLGFSLKKSF